MKRLRLIELLVVAAVSLAPPAHAAFTNLPVNKCLSGKVKGVGKSVAARTGCYSKDTAKPDAAALATCLGKADDKFDGGAVPAKGVFEKLEGKYPPASATPCLTFDDTASTNGSIAGYAAGVDTAVGDALGKCDAAKKKCVGKYVAGILGCYAKAAGKTGLIDTACTDKVTTKFTNGNTGCLDKAAANGDCTHAGSQTLALRNGADAFIKTTACNLDPGNPGCLCPISYSFTANGSDADYDEGWTGINHDLDMPSNSRLTLTVSGCPGTFSPCGTCALTGPITNPGGAGFTNRRCRGDSTGANGSWIACTSDVDCAGTGNACVFFFGPPRPDHFGFGELCALTEIASPVTGTVNPDDGTAAMTLPATFRLFIGPTIDDPCPKCTGGVCDSGSHVGGACSVQGTSTSFGDDVSLDCPPDAGAVVHVENVMLDLQTGTQTRTLTAASPSCRQVGHTGERCFCDTCNNAGAEVCSSNADCPISGGNPGICGGRRCLAGVNAGAPCTVASECPGSPCGVPGEPTQPNQCADSVCTANTPPDNASVDEGTCAAGPVESTCAMSPYHFCTMATDCPLAGDSCVAKPRDCFPDNGTIGGTVTAGGVANPTAPTLAGLFCARPATAGAINAIRGLPGLVRMTIPGIATFD